MSNFRTIYFEVAAPIAKKKSHTNINEPNFNSLDISSLKQAEKRKTLLFKKNKTNISKKEH